MRLGRSSVLLKVIVLLFIQAAIWITVVPAHAVQRCDFGDDIPRSRPNSEKGPTEVTLSLFIFDLVSVNDVREEFTLDFYIKAQWQDPRLGALVRKAGLDKCEISFDEIWRPNAFPLNAREYRSELPRIARVRADGTVKGEIRIIGTFSSPLDLRRFPLDSQTLLVSFISTRHSPDELAFVTKGAGAAQEFSEPGWSARLGRAYSSSYKMELLNGDEDKESLTRYDFEIEIKRDVRYYAWKVLLPLCIIVFASWTVFWIDPTQLGVQTGISTASMLTVIAFLLSLGNILPRVPYLTRIDIFIYSSLILVFLTFVEGLMTCTAAAHKKELLARRIDRWARVLLPSAFAILMGWFWWV